MRETRRTRVLWTILFVVWLCVVWGHSLMPADLSSEESSRFLFLVRPLFELAGVADEQLMTFAIRKTAHFCEHGVMVGIGVGFARAWLAERVGAMRRLVLSVWILVPVIDENIQRFVPGRDCRFTDVLIDMAGGVVGMLVAHLLVRRSRSKPRA